MKIIRNTDPMVQPSTIMMLYGSGGVGKTTFATTAPNPLLIDCENGSKYLKSRGLNIDTALVNKWTDIEDIELVNEIKGKRYETIIIDPIGELVDKLIDTIKTHPISKYRQSDGTPTQAGWGFIKQRIKSFIRFLRDTNKNIILIAHCEELKDEEKMIKRPLIATNVNNWIRNLVDIIAYMTIIQENGEKKRILQIDATNDKYISKDRTGKLGDMLEPDFSKILGKLKNSLTPEIKELKEKQEIKNSIKNEEKEQKEKIDKIKNLNKKLKEANNKSNTASISALIN